MDRLSAIKIYYIIISIHRRSIICFVSCMCTSDIFLVCQEPVGSDIWWCVTTHPVKIM